MDKWHGIVIEYVVNWDETAVDLWHEMTWNFYESPRHIFYGVLLVWDWTHFGGEGGVNKVALNESQYKGQFFIVPQIRKVTKL